MKVPPQDLRPGDVILDGDRRLPVSGVVVGDFKVMVNIAGLGVLEAGKGTVVEVVHRTFPEEENWQQFRYKVYDALWHALPPLAAAPCPAGEMDSDERSTLMERVQKAQEELNQLLLYL